MLPRRLILLLSLARPAPVAADAIPPPAAVDAAPLQAAAAPRCEALAQGAGGPFLEARVCAIPEHSPAPGRSNTAYSLFARTARGWFTVRLGTSGTLCGGRSLFPVFFDAPSLEPADGALVVRYRAGADAIRQSELRVCAVGPSGVPSCAGPLVVERDRAWSSTAGVDGAAVVLRDSTGTRRIPLRFP